jgi:hypothetical protein
VITTRNDLVAIALIAIVLALAGIPVAWIAVGTVIFLVWRRFW